jgi:hypothetical protein
MRENVQFGGREAAGKDLAHPSSTRQQRSEQLFLMLFSFSTFSSSGETHTS